MKKGDLVVRVKSGEDDDIYIEEFETAIVITSPSAAVFTRRDEQGKAVYSQERIVVDLLAGNKVIPRCPVDFIIKAKYVEENLRIFSHESKD